MFTHPDATCQIAMDQHRERLARAERARQLRVVRPRRGPLHRLVDRFRTPTVTHAARRFEAVLLTDIVGSTRRSLAAGDTRWHLLLNRHDEIVSELVTRHGGRSIKHTGDGFLATFTTPSNAVECGLAILDALDHAGVEARVGAHVGEVEVRSDGDITGVTVNLAARVAAHADGGGFWVSSTLRDTVLGSETVFDDQGYRDLAGTDRLWQLYSVPRRTDVTDDDVDHDVDRDPACDALADLDRALDESAELDHAHAS